MKGRPPPSPAARIVLLAAMLAAMIAATVGPGGTPARAAAEDPREVQGRTLFAKGDYEAALDIYATLFAEKGDPIYLRNVGRCNQKLRRPERAIDAFNEYLRRARRIKPTERQEVEGFIQEMQELQARMEASERARTATATATAAAAAAATPPATPPPATPAPASAADRPPRKGEDEPGSTGERAVPAEALHPIPGPPREVVERGPPGAGQRSQTGRFFLAVAVGSGFGIAQGSGELNPMHRLTQTGFALAQLGHAAPEIGVFVLPRLLVSAQLRLQYVSFLTGEHIAGSSCLDEYCEPNQLSESAFGRVAWLFGDGAVHVLAGVIVGGGNIRHAVVFHGDQMCGRDGRRECVDSLASGPFLFGPSLGLLVELGNTLNLVLGVNGQIGVPKHTLNLDVNGGFAIRL